LSDLLARFAESAFWLARYMERAENLARVIEVNETLAGNRDNPEDWLPIVEINADSARFFETHGESSAESVVHFYVLDRDNPTSITSAVRMARENARMLRHLISTELWTHLNVFYNQLEGIGPDDLRLSELPRLCLRIKEGCQMHAGIAEGTLYRDQTWYFHEIGKHLERADQTTRLLDIKFHRLLPSSEAVGSAFDRSQWNALLRSVAGYHAFRRIHPRGMQPTTVAGFLLFNHAFPRAVTLSVVRAAELLSRLNAAHDLPGTRVPIERAEALRRELEDADIAGVITGGLHEYLDSLQSRIGGITDAMGQGLFGHQADAA
jgi:uncharacterized alpha-E superfamily protein